MKSEGRSRLLRSEVLSASILWQRSPASPSLATNLDDDGSGPSAIRPVGRKRGSSFKQLAVALFVIGSKRQLQINDYF